MALVISGCAKFERAELAQRAKSDLVGYSKEELLTCMGAPNKRASAGDTEVWNYRSGGETVANTIGSGTVNRRRFFGSHLTTFHEFYCVVNVVMKQDQVIRVNYQGSTGGLLSEGEQCFYAVENCLQ